MHLGNARTFLLTWWWARAERARLILRIEDLDHPRKKTGAIEGLREDLKWMGIEWDAETPIQSSRSASHVRAINSLRAAGHVYVCRCSRHDVVDAQSAPHESVQDLVYPGTCRNVDVDPTDQDPSSAPPYALRFRVPSTPISVLDGVFGPQTFDLPQRSGDFVIGRVHANGTIDVGYQLAVVHDDAEDGITHVLRGADLLLSAARQRALQVALGLPPVHYAHFPLVVGTDGRRLAKRHGDTRLSTLRAEGMTQARLWSWVAETLDVPSATRDELVSRRLDLGEIPQSPVVLSQHHVAALIGRK